MRDSEGGSHRILADTFNFPAMCRDNLLDHGQSESGALLVSGEARFENFAVMFEG